MSLIVIEGVDGSGKSTLVEELQNLQSADVRHCGQLKQSALIEYEASLRDYKPTDDSLTLCDRWHIGELIYGPLLRGESKLSPSQFEHVELYLSARGALKLWVQTPISEIMRRIDSRGEELIPHHAIPYIWDWYHRFLSKQHGWLPVSGMNAHKSTLTDVLETAEMKCLEAQFLEQFRKYYIGGPNVDVLIVMENAREYVNKNFKWDAPFKPFPGTFADNFLTEAHKTGLPRRYGIAASNQPDLGLLLRYLSYKKVVVVGQKAWAAFEEVTTDPYVSFPLFSGPEHLVSVVRDLL